MSHYFATCPKGLEYLLRDELIAMGAVDVREALAGAHFSGTLETAYRACLWSSLASRILLPLADFDAADDDARGIDGCVSPRIARLRATIEAMPTPPLLVGSSMGAFVSGLASLDVPVLGLLLLATPSTIPGYARAFDLRGGVPTMLIHGWRDDVCQPAGVQMLAAQRRLPLLMLDDDHRLGASTDAIALQFQRLLDQLATAA